jgi:phosphate:Na+ symporter
MGREKILEDIALQRTPMATARAALDTLAWADLALYHSWHVGESLRIASWR